MKSSGGVLEKCCSFNSWCTVYLNEPLRQQFLHGDLGWYESSRRALYQAVKYLTRLIVMPNDALTRKVLVAQQQLVHAAEPDGVSSWLARLKRSLCMWPTGETIWRALEASPGFHFDVTRTVRGLNGEEKEARL